MNSWDDFVTALSNRWPGWYQYKLQLQFSDMVRTKLQLASYGVILPAVVIETETENQDG